MLKHQVLLVIGKERWEEFEKFMEGQTVSIIDGEVDYYEHDVDNFLNNKLWLD
jgi:hypothetical protein